mmetsp:Transcript_2687/g.8303  ORF Transcript_2687/g.8303 Transcript_2687/m.8303 type:complete len:239 (-) Transcript_2687:74-790(-)
MLSDSRTGKWPSKVLFFRTSAATSVAWNMCSAGKSRLSRMRSHISSPRTARVIIMKGRFQKMACHLSHRKKPTVPSNERWAPPMIEKNISISQPVKRESRIEKAHIRKKAWRSRKMVNHVVEIQGLLSSMVMPISSQMDSMTSVAGEAMVKRPLPSSESDLDSSLCASFSWYLSRRSFFISKALLTWSLMTVRASIFSSAIRSGARWPPEPEFLWRFFTVSMTSKNLSFEFGMAAALC